jgi:RNA polymerase sigma factor (sigma-70 family)
MTTPESQYGASAGVPPQAAAATDSTGGASLEQEVARAAAGDRPALERVVARIQPDVYRLALRFLWHPEDAEDATQEILMRVVARLATFRGESAFRTWVFRVAANTLLTTRARRAEQRALTVPEFAADLERGLSDAAPAEPGIEHALLLEEVRIGCTMAMLSCLDRPHRLAYILGEILDLDHNEAAAALEIRPAAFRARLSRARRTIRSLLSGHCGLVNPANACRCSRRVQAAVELRRVDPRRLLFTTSAARARAFPAVLATIRALEEGQRAAALYRAQPDASPPAVTAWVREWVRRFGAGTGGSPA